MSEQQRRGRRIAMTEQEQDEFLRAERTCRVATTSELGPHNAPLWFWWDGSHVWLNSVVASQRWRERNAEGAAPGPEAARA